MHAGLIIHVHNTNSPNIWGGKFSQHRGGPSNYYLPDFQGNTRQLADINQAVSDTLILDAWGREVVSTGTTANPFRAFGQYGYQRDTATRLYVQARHLDVVSGRWVSRDPLQWDFPYRYGMHNSADHSGAIVNLRMTAPLYAFASNSPIRVHNPYFEPGLKLPGFRRVFAAAAVGATDPCPVELPNDGNSADYAIACSKNRVTAISASFILPQMCNVKGNYINFYVSMGGCEGGVSYTFTDKWRVFLNCPHEIDKHYKNVGALHPGTVVNLSLSRNPQNGIDFIVNGQQKDHTSDNYMKAPKQARLVNAASRAKGCLPAAHSEASWINITVDGGLLPQPTVFGDEEIIQNRFSSRLRHPASPCD